MGLLAHYILQMSDLVILTCVYHLSSMQISNVTVCPSHSATLVEAYGQYMPEIKITIKLLIITAVRYLHVTS